ncbi:ATP-dependent Clp protease ATP-binding subunit ClpA homolog CD4B, chloroplastic-like [Castanea sativa]|uniref:ATP-dependent Clp protease ATP-binding subunit ClpA homolog CD4B, chloroplastic-like n=1 Tax=Castanea sativa TaxID=21020 RepID=UPI003F64FEAA
MEKLSRQPFEIDVLMKYGTDLTKMAGEGKLDPVIGRQHQLERVEQILLKRRKNNPCLVGDPGVGKTVIVEGLAQAIANATVPPKLQDKKVFAIDMGRLVAGASCRGEFEERITQLVDEVKQSDGSIILFIDEVHTLIGAGSGIGELDAANMLKPALARGELKCIGATTQDEYRKYIEADSALKRRFQSVEVPEPSVDEAIEILKLICGNYETHHNVKYSEEALVAAARLSNQYISDRFLPDKAIDLIDEAGAHVQLQNLKVLNERRVLLESDIQQIVSLWTGIPIEIVTPEESQWLLNMENALHNRIIGQHEAIEAVSRAVRRARAGIRHPMQPIASFMFTGPTGVGKTELANALAVEYFGSKESMIRLDMSEYMESHTVSKLFGSPPGYIGYDEGGQLTEAVRLRPHSLILFDEIEKAHPLVFNVMLQILDDGRLTDNKGRKVDFKNAVIIMTSNIGGGFIMREHSLGFDQVKMEVAEELRENFRPEFLNRIDEVVLFRQLSSSEIKEIADIMLKEVSERLIKAKKIKLKVNEKVREMLVREGFNPNYGARPLRRNIVRLLEDNLAEEVLRGNIKEGDSVTIGLDDKGDIKIF